MSEQQHPCAETERKLILDDIWTELTALENALGNAHDYADIFKQLADKLDSKNPIHRAYIALAYCWSDRINESQAAFIRLVNRVNELRALK